MFNRRSIETGREKGKKLPLSRTIIRFLNEACHNQPTYNALDGHMNIITSAFTNLFQTMIRWTKIPPTVCCLEKPYIFMWTIVKERKRRTLIKLCSASTTDTCSLPLDTWWPYLHIRNVVVVVTHVACVVWLKIWFETEKFVIWNTNLCIIHSCSIFKYHTENFYVCASTSVYNGCGFCTVQSLWISELIQSWSIINVIHTFISHGIIFGPFSVYIWQTCWKMAWSPSVPLQFLNKFVKTPYPRKYEIDKMCFFFSVVAQCPTCT